MPDPNDYTAVFPHRGFANFEQSVVQTIADLEAAARPAAASRVRTAYVDYVGEQNIIAQEIAALAQRLIVDHERSSRVRPDTGGGGGARLEDHVGHSDPLPDLPGSVAVNNLRELDQNVSWWWTNEIGYGGHVGREIHGWFMDAGFSGPTRPNPSMAGQHPLFMASKSGGRGTIQEPIPERRFVQRGVQEAEVEWHRRIARARQQFINRIAPILRGP